VNGKKIMKPGDWAQFGGDAVYENNTFTLVFYAQPVFTVERELANSITKSEVTAGTDKIELPKIADAYKFTDYQSGTNRFLKFGALSGKMPGYQYTPHELSFSTQLSSGVPEVFAVSADADGAGQDWSASYNSGARKLEITYYLVPTYKLAIETEDALGKATSGSGAKFTRSSGTETTDYEFSTCADSSSLSLCTAKEEPKLTGTEDSYTIKNKLLRMKSRRTRMCILPSLMRDLVSQLCTWTNATLESSASRYYTWKKGTDDIFTLLLKFRFSDAKLQVADSDV
jgi:hypothetical protein